MGFYKNFQNYGLHFTQRPLNYLAITQHILNKLQFHESPSSLPCHVLIRQREETTQWLRE